MVFCREGAWIRTLLPKGASIRNFPYLHNLSQLRKKLQKGTSTRGLHDRNPARPGAAHFAGAPSKLCIYDNSTTTTMTLPARCLINTNLSARGFAIVICLLILCLFWLCLIISFGRVAFVVLSVCLFVLSVCLLAC